MHAKSDNIKVMIYDDANEITEQLFESLLSRYQISLETTMRGSDFIFDYVNLIYYKYHKIMSILNAVVHILILRTG